MIAWSWFLLVIVTGWLKLLDGYTDRMLGRLAIMVEPRIGMKAPPPIIDIEFGLVSLGSAF
jgi:hypothetical protein